MSTGLETFNPLLQTTEELLHSDSNCIVLERFAYSPDGTFGKLVVPTKEDTELFYTVECPWLHNIPFTSCIPEGIYSLIKTNSNTVKRITGGKYDWGYQLKDVPERSHILIHPGNWPTDFEGCIGVGQSYAVIKGANGVTNSRKAYSQLVSILEAKEEWKIIIRPKRIQSIPVYGTKTVH